MLRASDAAEDAACGRRARRQDPRRRSYSANTIDGFARHADGSITAMAGSPFAAGGAGLGTGLASQGAIQATQDGRYLLVDGSGMHFVSVFAVSGGTLTEVPSSPTPLPAGVTSSAGIVNI